jgi:cytochrome P450
MEEYVSDSASFRPERYLKNQQQCPMHSNKVHPFASLPYGYGARMCLGRRFADLEIQVLLAKVSSTPAKPWKQRGGNHKFLFFS